MASIYRDITDIHDTYTTKRMKVPAPRFVVFYNGTAPMEDQRVYKLSYMFAHKMDKSELELVVRVIDINDGHNEELMESCKSLKQYSILLGWCENIQKKNQKQIKLLDFEYKARRDLFLSGFANS